MRKVTEGWNHRGRSMLHRPTNPPPTSSITFPSRRPFPINTFPLSWKKTNHSPPHPPSHPSPSPHHHPHHPLPPSKFPSTQSLMVTDDTLHHTTAPNGYPLTTLLPLLPQQNSLCLYINTYIIYRIIVLPKPYKLVT